MELTAIFAENMGMQKICIMFYDENGRGVLRLSYVKMFQFFVFWGFLCRKHAIFTLF